MAVVKKAQSSPNIILKKDPPKPPVRSIKQPSAVREMGDVDFGDLNASKNGLLVAYDSTSNKFILTSPDKILSTSVEDNDLPDDFITQLEQELDLGTIQIDNLDGGVF